MRVCGVIGGIGPAATAALYLETLRFCRDLVPTARPEIVISSIGLDLAAERDLLSGTGEPEKTRNAYAEAVSRAVRRLEEAGADFLAVPSNTVCSILGNLQYVSTLPVMDIIGETVSSVSETGLSTVLVLSTGHLSEKGAYRESLDAKNISSIWLDRSGQSRLDSVIRNAVDGHTSPQDVVELESLVRKGLAKGADGAILACTDLQSVARHSDLLSEMTMSDSIVDSLTCLAESVARETIQAQPGSTVSPTGAPTDDG